MMHRRIIAVLFTSILLSSLINSRVLNASELLVYLDDSGVIRWAESHNEVSLFGANYCLPSACDYRAARYFTNDLKAEIEKDMAHFVRMGWDGLRICFWGDYQNSDSLGNLVSNDHLDLMDYLVYEAGRRGLYMLLSPIVTYSSQWPDAMDVPASGFSAHFKKSELGTNPAAISAQVNYIQQLLNHVNPYTGNPVKDEPNILFIEMINEPWHHSHDMEGSLRYLNSLANAVRATGCEKIIFHNVSQDFGIAEAIRRSDIQGASFAWYPSGLVSGRTLKGNFLRTVDHYNPMHITALDNMPRIVYEFDAPDLLCAEMYPAMVRTFRGVGAQFTAMFAYDMLVSAKANLGWQTHFLNLVYTPQKAAGAIIAAEAMRKLPLYQTYGEYPSNINFGHFSISYENKLAEYITEEVFMHSGHTSSTVPAPGKLTRIVGFKSSNLVDYEGDGLYFLDKVADGVWRLEVYPDAFFVKDPFAQISPEKIVSRLMFNKHLMRINLPDIGHDFSAIPANEGNNYSTRASMGEFIIYPGVYTLINRLLEDTYSLPEKIYSLAYNEYVVPAPEIFPLELRHEQHQRFQEGQTIDLSALVVDNQSVDSVKVFVRRGGSRFRQFNMTKGLSGMYEVHIPANNFSAGYYDYCITVYQNKEKTTYPSGIKKCPSDWDFYSTEFWPLEIVSIDHAFPLFIPAHDFRDLSFTRIGDAIRHGIFRVMPMQNDQNGVFRIWLPREMDYTLDDYTASLYIGDRIANMKKPQHPAKILLRGRGINGGDEAWLTLVESDGTAWTSKITFSDNWEYVELNMESMKPGKGVMLPQGFPGNWNYWLLPPAGRGGNGDKINFNNIEHLQISIRLPSSQRKDNYGVEISFVGVKTTN